MSFDLSHIKPRLSHSGNTSLHRKVFILAGEVEWQKNLLNELLLDCADAVLWVGEDDADGYPFVETKKATSWLGKEKQVVVFDANKDFSPDSFAAISGIVVGGGLFFLLLPKEEKWNEVYSTKFGQRLINSIKLNDDLILVEKNDESVIPDYRDTKSSIANSATIRNCEAPFLTLDQQHAVETIYEQIRKESHTPIVLVSDRGRGKSAALGIATAQLIKSGVATIAITAPSLSAVDIIFKHIKEVLPAAEITRGGVKFVNKNKSRSVVQFYSPDNLMQENIKADVLLVDEAAAIPVPLLTSFLHQYPQCVFATTVHGYEGTGRGFALRFYKELDKNNKNWLKLQMHTPIRWAENDPLEAWMFSLLCLDADISNEVDLTGFDINTIECHLLNKKQLDDNDLLSEVFALLVLAHYRTRPKDLMHLLDDEAISVYVSLYNKHVIAVALVVREGTFTSSLSSEVYQGKRRPQGHLLAQALTYHCGIEQAASLDYSRIMRIAVHPVLQQQGLGTTLIDFVVSAEKQLGRDAIGTSFGMNVPLLNFWKKSNFDVVRIGFTREQTGGEHAAIMLHPLNTAGEKIYLEAQTRFKQQLPYWFDDVLKDIPVEIKNKFSLLASASLELNKFEIKDLQSFNLYNRHYEICISSINKFVSNNISCIDKNDFPAEFRNVLYAKVVEKKDWKEVGMVLNLSGKNEARKVFHKAIHYLSKIT